LGNALRGGLFVPIPDVSRQLFGKRYFKKNVRNMDLFGDRLVAQLEQRILLPVFDKAVDGIIALESKGENIGKMSIVIDQINQEEKVLSSDTLSYVPDTVLNVVTFRIPVLNADLLNIRIRAEGKPLQEAYVAFSKLEIFIAGKSLDEYPLRELPPLQLRQKGVPLSSKMEDIPLELKKVMAAKVIGLGEAAHGCQDIQRFSYDLMMDSVTNHNCKLVLLEQPLSYSLFYNRYINDENYQLDEWRVPSMAPEIMRFLNRLRAYNRTLPSHEKVRLFGMDYSIDAVSGLAYNLFDFITSISSYPRSIEVDRFLSLIMQQDWLHAIPFFEEYKDQMAELLSEDEIVSLSHIMRLSQSVGTDRARRYALRDSVMGVNARFLIDRFAPAADERVFVYAHAGHVNPISTYPSAPCTPLGGYMRARFQDDYSCFLITIGHGSKMAYGEDFNYANKSLEEPPVNSLEAAMDAQSDSLFYLGTSPELNRLLLARYQGLYHTNEEFYPFNLYQRFAGIFFIKRPFVPSGQQIGISAEKRTDMFKLLFNKRQEAIDAINKRIQALK
jgi:erythromycin esterase-like protein